MGADILAANPVKKTGFVHDQKGLRVRAAENEMFAAFAKFFVQVFERVQAGCVHGEHFSHAENKDLRLLPRALERSFEFVSGTEEKSP